MKYMLHIKRIFSILLAVVDIILIAEINYQIIGSWFGKNGPANLGSIEVSYVSMARFIIDYGFSSWAPFWYFGFPFHLFYTPLLPFLEVVLHQIWKMPLWESYRFLTGVAYIVGPISLFFLGWQLSRKVIGGLISGMLYTVMPSFMYFIVPEVASDKFSNQFLDPRRFTILVRWGEGPHLFSLMFLPLVGVCLYRLYQEKKMIWLFLTSVFFGLTALTNAIGFFSSILLITCMTFVSYVHKKDSHKQTFLLAFLVGIITFGLISFWYNLSFISSFFKEGVGSGGLLLSIFPWGWIGIISGIAVLYWLIKKVIKDFAIAFSLLWFSIFFTVVSTYYLSASPDESFRRIELLPQALRYNVEVDLSFALLVGVFIGWLIRIIGKKIKILEIAGDFIGLLIVIGLGLYILPYFSIASKAAGEEVNLSKTSEYRVSMWLKDRVETAKGERVFVPGNYGFYLNYFTDVWQHRGGLFQAATHKWPDHIHYQIAAGKNADITKAWLVASNIKYAVVTTPPSSEIYKEIKYPAKFTDFKLVYDKNGDFIYEVPLKRPSMAKPVNVSSMLKLEPPVKADDKSRLLPYADWVENSSDNNLDFEVINNDNYKISGQLGPGEGILVQMTADSGWKAVDSISLKKIKTGHDPLGFLMLYPGPGNVSIILKHGLTAKQWIGYFLTLITVILLIGYAFLGRRILGKYEKMF